MSNRKTAGLFTVVVLMLTARVLAWNAHGHALCSSIVYDELSPSARKACCDLLKQHPQCEDLMEKCPEGFDPDRYLFMRASTWPDLIRDPKNPMNTEHHSQWHYIDFPFIASGEIRVQRPDPVWKPGTDPANAVQAIARCEAVLASSGARADERAIALCWILHVVGDIHQPLHAVSFYSKDFPKGDQGGNLQWIESNGKPIKLHAYWDNALGVDDDAHNILEQAEQLRARFPRSEFVMALRAANPAAWALESYDLARTEVYREGALKSAIGTPISGPPETAPALPADYDDRARSLSDRQVALAAHRLADVLGGLFVSARN